jgi:hypothetical protein
MSTVALAVLVLVAAASALIFGALYLSEREKTRIGAASLAGNRPKWPPGKKLKFGMLVASGAIFLVGIANLISAASTQSRFPALNGLAGGDVVSGVGFMLLAAAVAWIALVCVDDWFKD